VTATCIGYLVASEAYGVVGTTRRFARLDCHQWPASGAAGTVVRLTRDGAGTLESVSRLERRWTALGS